MFKNVHALDLEDSGFCGSQDITAPIPACAGAGGEGNDDKDATNATNADVDAVKTLQFPVLDTDIKNGEEFFLVARSGIISGCLVVGDSRLETVDLKKNTKNLLEFHHVS